MISVERVKSRRRSKYYDSLRNRKILKKVVSVAVKSRYRILVCDLKKKKYIYSHWWQIQKLKSTKKKIKIANNSTNQ